MDDSVVMVVMMCGGYGMSWFLWFVYVYVNNRYMI